MTSYPRERVRQERELMDQYDWYSCNGTEQYPEAFTPTENVTTRDEYTSDEIHTDYPMEGGPFCSRKVIYTPGRLDHEVWAGYGYTDTGGAYYAGKQHGALVIAPPPSAALPTKASCIASCKAYGAEAWNKFSPKPYVKNLGQFFGELHESFKMLYDVRLLAQPEKIMLLRSYKNLLTRSERAIDVRRSTSWPVVWRFLRSLAKTSANTYLAYEFGWKPFVEDLTKLLKSVDIYDRRLAKIRKDNAKWIRRRGTLRDTSNSVTSVLYNGYKQRVINSTMWIDPKFRYETITSEKVWFVGKFRYIIPGLEDQSYIGKANRLRRLYGVEITPWLVWKLTPWSWMADWFSNADHILGNISDMATHNVVAKYAYVMRETTSVRTMTYFVKCKRRTSYTPGIYITEGPFYAQSHTTTSTKTRHAASPFGFELDWPEFDSWRLSILTALGISRVL